MYASSKPNSNPAIGRHRCQPARAFTLVELMVVMVILSIFASLAISGILSARASGRIAKTTSTIRKLNEIILPYYEQYETRRPTLPDITGMSRTQISNLRQIALRRLIAAELPERTTDIEDAALELYGLAEVPPVARRYKSITAGQSVDSAQLLHLIVTRGPVADPDIISHFRPDERADLSGDGVPDVFLDGWNRPIRFLRWPIGFTSPVQPIDGSLSSRDLRFSRNGHRLVPLIFSAGPDGIYDIAQNVGVGLFRYFNFDYDPFLVATAEGIREDPTGVADEVVLWPVNYGSGASATTTYAAARVAAGGVLTPPVLSSDVGVNGGTMGSNPFQTIGSERALDNPGTLGSRDNIHNHSMPR